MQFLSGMDICFDDENEYEDTGEIVSDKFYD